jgi:hypothetical protein
LCNTPSNSCHFGATLKGTVNRPGYRGGQLV